MKDQGYHISGDLRRAMEQEAHEEQQAEAEAAWFDAINTADDAEQLRETRRDLAEKRNDIEQELSELRRKIDELEAERDRAQKRKRHVERRIREVDPEVIIEITAHDTRRYGWETGATIEKAPPMADRTHDDDGPKIMNRPVTKTVADALEEITADIDPEDYDDRDVVATVHFEDLDDDNPTVNWAEPSNGE